MTNDWKKFATWLIAAFSGALVISCAIIVVYNPYHNIPFSPPMHRDMMDSNQRYLYPSLARDTAYDSAVFGASSMRLLKPEILNEGLNAHFAMLALNAGTPWEQYRLIDLFLQERETPKAMVLGIDLAWCLPNKDYDGQTNRLFPEWVYDDNPYNDLLYLLNATSLEVALRQLGRYLSLEDARYGADGYLNFLPPYDEYDLVKARVNIYGQPDPIALPDAVDESIHAAPYSFPVHELYAKVLDAIPAKTKTIIVFPPHHYYYYLNNKARIDVCKSEIIAITRKNHSDAVILDLMISSAITTKDENYWDHIHYDAAIGDLIAGAIVNAVEDDDIAPFMRRIP